MKTTYTFTILRYVHDIATGEFVNMGVALYAPEAKYVSAICCPRYGRLSKMFLDVNGDQLRPLMRFIQARFEEYALKLNGELPLQGQPKSVMEIAANILSRDDSSLQWSESGGGITENPSATLEQLYVRLVEKYEMRAQLPSRTDDEVWRGFKKELEMKQVLAKLQPKRIIAKDYEHEFDHAWKNGTWNLYQPVSFDLIDAESLLDKANRWLGRATILKESQERFKLHVLLGEPRLEKLKSSYGKALNILNRMPVKKEFIREDEAPKFSRDLADEIQHHKE
ncbi:MAG: DUF3037 domain-containing protein [Verrucomicrobiales bacterium]|nr:DUF3037 domain-containing protein [Verrucomicrobiales bacterium]